MGPIDRAQVGDAMPRYGVCVPSLTRAMPHGAYSMSMKLLLAIPRTVSHRCAGCPGDRDGVFDTSIGAGRSACAFLDAALEPRAALPTRWFGERSVALVRRGLVLRTRTDSNGRVQGVDLAGPGHLVPLDATSTLGATPGGFAVTRAHLCLSLEGSIDRAIDQRDDAHARDVHDLVRLQRDAMRRVERFAEARGRRGSEARVAALLGVIIDELGVEGAIPEELQQRDLALLLGIRHESVCRSLGILERAGLLSTREGGLWIHDRAALEK